MDKTLSKVFRIGSKKDLVNRSANVSVAGSMHEGGNDAKSCSIRTLEEEIIQAIYTREDKGQNLLDYVFDALEVSERDYFGLRYVDSDGQRNWLDPTRSIHKQVRGVHPVVFSFRVKFYPATPTIPPLREEFTRHLIYLQLRRDLAHGRLYATGDEAAQLMALIVQSELGDYDPAKHGLDSKYLTQVKLALNQTVKLEDKIMEIHKNGHLQGTSPRRAQSAFLKRAVLLDTFGVDPHPVKDHKGLQLYLGVNHTGILSFQGNRKAHHFKWADIQKISYEGRMFIVQCLQGDKKNLNGFKCPTTGACHYLWKCAVEQRYFFTINSASEIPAVTTSGGLFSRGCKLRYSGRTQREIFRDTIRQRQSIASQSALGMINGDDEDDDDEDDDENQENGLRRGSSATLPQSASTEFNRNSLPPHSTVMVKSSSGQSYHTAVGNNQNANYGYNQQTRTHHKQRSNGSIMMQDIDMGTCAASEDGAALAGRPQSQISRSFSITSAPPAVRSIGRSNTAPLPCESPECALYQDNVVPYANYSSISEPYSMNNSHYPTMGGITLDPFDEDLELEATNQINGGQARGHAYAQNGRIPSHPHLLPTEFDLRPDVTPTGEDSPSRSRSHVGSHYLLDPISQGPHLNTASPSHHLRPDLPNSRASHSSITSNSSLCSGSESEQTPVRAAEKRPPVTEKLSNGSSSVSRKGASCDASSKSLCWARFRAALVALILLLVTCALVCIFLFESEMDFARNMREWPEVDMIRDILYDPVRAVLVQNQGKNV